MPEPELLSNTPDAAPHADAERRARVESSAAQCEAVAAELERAAQHMRTAARHYRNLEIPRACAHILAAYGHSNEAEATINELARVHAARSQPQPEDGD
ncbi:MAG: hypothetical protein MUD01_28175 [Chloroflexaceae bacterium]|jgi:hypothetical protein|nr:hypothetical protein [Chloroflexaceae bacterium]